MAIKIVQKTQKLTISNAGVQGKAGSHGTSGTSGAGTSGTSGISGTNGSSGSSGTSGLNGTFFGSSGTSGTSGLTQDINHISGSIYVSGSIIPNAAEGELTSSFSLGSATNAWKDLWISKGTIYFIGDNNQSASITLNEDNQIVISDINLTGSLTASLSEGYIWVGGADNKNIAIPTSSLVTGGGQSGTSGVDGTSGTSGLTITGSAGSHGTSGTSGISVLADSGSFATTGSNTFVDNQTISGALYMVSNDSEPIVYFGDGNGSVGLGMGSMTVVGNNYLGLFASGDNTSYITLTSAFGQTGFLYSDGGGIETQFSINQSGSFDLFANLGTASLLINHIPYDAHLVTTSSFNQYTSSVVATLPNGVISSSQQITDFGFVSSSTTDTTQLNNFTSSIRGEIDGIEAYTASLKATTLISGAAQITALGFGAGGGSDITLLNQFSGSINSYTSSNDSVRNRILQTTASLNTTTGSFRIELNSIEAYTASLKNTSLISGSGQLSTLGFATLTANTFVGNQIITGSLIVSSTVVSDANLFTSSSNLVLNSGSNFYINNNGLAQISGSLKVTGSATINDILVLTPRTTNPANPISGSFIVSSSGETIKPFFWDGNDWQALY